MAPHVNSAGDINGWAKNLECISIAEVVVCVSHATPTKIVVGVFFLPLSLNAADPLFPGTKPSQQHQTSRPCPTRLTQRWCIARVGGISRKLGG